MLLFARICALRAATLPELALSRRGWSTLDALAARDLLLAFSNVVQVLTVDQLVGVLLSHRCRTALCRLI